MTIGVVQRPHGIKGEVVVEPFSDNESRFEDLVEVRVVGPRGGRMLTVDGFFPHKGRLVIQFDEIRTVEAAEILRGAELRVPLTALPQLPKGSYYHHELKGLDVRIESGESIGVVEDIFETGAAPVLVIRDSSKTESLVPLVDAFILEVDVPGGFMRVKAKGVVRS